MKAVQTTTTYGYEDNFYVITGTGANKRLPTVAVVTEKNADNEVVSRTYTDPYGQTVREEVMEYVPIILMTSRGMCLQHIQGELAARILPHQS